MANTTPITPDKMTFAKGFAPRNLQIVFDKGRTLICAFEGTWNGRDVFNIRELYEQFGDWNPGKGIMVPVEQRAELLTALANLPR